jgi:glycosyltransferase involved in cell wall biosynthesis
MVGPTKDESYQETVLLAKALDLEVNFTGLLTKEEWLALSNEYSIFINTTHFDNTPVSVIEAMALGLPIVSTNVGGIPFLIQENTNGLLVSDGNSMEMVSQIKRLINNPDLVIQLSKNARETVEKFDWKIVKKQWFELLK